MSESRMSTAISGGGGVEVVEPLRQNISGEDGFNVTDVNNGHIETMNTGNDGSRVHDNISQGNQTTNGVVSMDELLVKYGPPVGMIIGGGKGGNMSPPPKKLKERYE